MGYRAQEAYTVCMVTAVWGTTTRADGDWQLDTLSEARILEALQSQAPTNAVWLEEQLHGKNVVSVGRNDHGPVGKGDGLVTDSLGTVMTVRTADCVPLFLISELAAGLVHAGFEGVRKGILKATLGTLEEQHGINPASVRIHLGPHICDACFELRDEWLEGAQGDDKLAPFLKPRRRKYFFSLAEALIAEAEAAGARVESTSKTCTKHDDTHFSHRGGDGEARQLSYLMLRDA